MWNCCSFLLCVPTKKEMSDEAAVLKKELQQVKSRAVSKIKSLQATVDDLTAKLNAATAKDSADARVSPLESSEDDVSSASSGSGFVKVGTPPAESAAAEVLRHRERELEMREAALAQREERLVQREQIVAAADAAAAIPLTTVPSEAAAAGRLAAWHATLLSGLRDVQSNLQQVEFAAEAAGVR